MISYEKALALLSKTPPLTPSALSARDACGYVAAQEVKSKAFLPPFANSAMDGFAVRSSDLAKASKKTPVTLPRAGSTAAGEVPASGSGGAWEIMTGAPMPQGYDAVVKIEDVTLTDKGAVFTAPVAVKNNVRAAGEDFAQGAALIQSGTMITPAHIMALAAAGQETIAVYPKPDITIFSTGKELIDDAHTPLAPGQIRNSNNPYMMAALKTMPVRARDGGVIPDEPDVFEARVRARLPDSDIIISSGAVSAGKHDFVPASLRRLGAEIVFHKVAVRPGRPLLYARFPNGAHYFGLPGNPVSAVAGLRFFVIPLLRHIQGMAAETPLAIPLAAPYPKQKGLRFFCKAAVSVSAKGQLSVKILSGQESFKIYPLLQANCWASLSETQERIKTGEPVEVYPLAPDGWNLPPRPVP